MQAINNRQRVVCFTLLLFFGFFASAQFKFVYQPKDIRVPVAKILLSDSSLIYGYAMAITDSTLFLHQNFDSPESLALTRYHYADIRQIQYHRKGDFKAGFNRGFWPFEILFASSAIQNWDSGWGVFILAAGTMASLPPGVVLGVVENSYQFNKTYAINQSQNDFKKHYRFAKNKIKPSWTGISQTHTGKKYVSEILNETVNYRVNRTYKWNFSVFTGINYSNFNRALQRAYVGTHLLTEQSASMQTQYGFGLSYAINPTIEVGYQHSDGLEYDYRFLSSNASVNSTVELRTTHYNNTFYVMKHFVVPDFDQKMIRLSGGAGINLAEISNSSYINSWDAGTGIWQDEYSNKYLMGTSVQLKARSEFIWNERFAVFLQTELYSPVRSSFKAHEIQSPTTMGISHFDFRYYVIAFNYGAHLYF